MKFLAWFLGLFSLAVALSLAAHNPGYVQLVYPPYRLEMSFTFFVLTALALFVLGYFFVRLLLSVARLPEYVRQFRVERAHSQGRLAMAEALGAFFSGYYALAERAAVRAIKLGEDRDLSRVVAARSAHQLRAFDRRDKYLIVGHDEPDGFTTMRLMAQAEFSIDQHWPQAALQSLNDLREAGIKSHVSTLRLELKAQQQAHNLDAVLKLVDQLEGRGGIDAAVAMQLRQKAWLEKISVPMLDVATLRVVWTSAPDEFKKLPKVRVAAVRVFINHGDLHGAQKIIKDGLDADWDDDLAALYGECLTEKVRDQIEQAERWLKLHPDNAGLLLMLGKLCLHQGLWNKAQNYLDASNGIAPSSAAYVALGHLAEKLQQPNEALGYFQKAVAQDG